VSHSKKLNGSKTCLGHWIHSESFKSDLIHFFLQGHISDIVRVLPKLSPTFNTLPFFTVDLTIGNGSVESGLSAMRRSVPRIVIAGGDVRIRVEFGLVFDTINRFVSRDIDKTHSTVLSGTLYAYHMIYFHL
jgi:hypothetical protein